ncbi:hypothetical protein PPERSA_05302 [Pseudocohnilembus persalinus]|uniref:Transmembrane protein n=1 Tax=Pseudocohnilembus persalinus TaxID=266149 RepID=A0A0V0R5X9_PSEPJ|nr:hypothetical protein PPERSA_05302 [Pseudocohnilembus persalinus]|eukprot:KRX09910.1 hypothetical protein PPERSA_05302 [Pseudocohnilembus persalinus]
MLIIIGLRFYICIVLSPKLWKKQDLSDEQGIGLNNYKVLNSNFAFDYAQIKGGFTVHAMEISKLNNDAQSLTDTGDTYAFFRVFDENGDWFSDFKIQTFCNQLGYFIGATNINQEFLYIRMKNINNLCVPVFQYIDIYGNKTRNTKETPVFPEYQNDIKNLQYPIGSFQGNFTIYSVCGQDMNGNQYILIGYFILDDRVPQNSKVINDPNKVHQFIGSTNFNQLSRMLNNTEYATVLLGKGSNLGIFTYDKLGNILCSSILTTENVYEGIQYFYGEGGYGQINQDNFYVYPDVDDSRYDYQYIRFEVIDPLNCDYKFFEQYQDTHILKEGRVFPIYKKDSIVNLVQYGYVGDEQELQTIVYDWTIMDYQQNIYGILYGFSGILLLFYIIYI